MIRTWGSGGKWRRRVGQAARFWEASFALFVLALPIWIFNKLLDVLPLNGQLPPLSWWYYVFSYVTLWAVFFWAVSRLNPRLWKSMKRFMPWVEEKKEDDYYP